MWRRQISTVFYLRKRADVVFTHTVALRSVRTERPMPSETDASAHERELPDSVVRAQLDPRQRGLLPIPAAAALPLVRRTTTGRAGPFAQRVGSRPRVVGRGRTSTAAPIPSFGWTPGAFATNCASTTVDPIPSSSRCRRAATCPPSKRIPPHPPTRLLQSFLRSRSRRRPVRTSGSRGSPSALWRSSLRLSSPRLPGAHSAGERSSPAAPLGFMLGVEGPPALSPDGNLVAFVWSGHADRTRRIST